MSQPPRRRADPKRGAAEELGAKDLFTIISEETAAKKAARSRGPSRTATPVGEESTNEKKEGEPETAETAVVPDGPEDSETTLLFVGPKYSGKTSLVMRFLNKPERDNPPKTTALEYTYARREKNDMAKDVVNVWELAGGKDLANLMEHAITPASVMTSSVAIVVDLSQPSEVLDNLLFWIERIRQHCEQVLRGSPAAAMMRQNVVAPEHEDAAILQSTVLPIPVVIIANKNDTFQDTDAEYRKAMSRALRYVAHVYGCTLIYTTCKVASTKTDIVRAWLNHYCFGTAAPKSVSADHHKTIVIPAGADIISKIGPPPSVRGEQANPNDVRSTIKMWRDAFNQEFFPPSQNAEKKEQWEHWDQYAEPLVDAMRAQKDEELDRYRRTCDQKAREDMSLRSALKGGSIQVVTQ